MEETNEIIMKLQETALEAEREAANLGLELYNINLDMSKAQSAIVVNKEKIQSINSRLNELSVIINMVKEMVPKNN